MYNLSVTCVEEELGEGRMKVERKVKKLLERVQKSVLDLLDTGADQMAKTFIHQALPPLLTPRKPFYTTIHPTPTPGTAGLSTTS